MNLKPIDKLIVVGDLHFGANSNSREWLYNFLTFFNLLLIPHLDKLADAGEIDKYTILLLGDLYDKKQVIDTLVQNESLGIIHKLSTYCQVHAIIGNHDTPREKDRHINNCKAISYMNNVMVHVDPFTLKTVAGESILLMPWMSRSVDNNPEIEAIESRTDCQYAFAHTEVYGFSYENKQVEDTTSLTPDHLSHLKRFWSGHIHKRQSKGNITFTGTPYHIRPVEYRNEVGYTVVDFSKLDNDGIPHETFIENKVSPKYVKIGLYRLLDMDTRTISGIFKNNYVKVRVTNHDLANIDISKVFSYIPEVYKNLDYELVHQYKDITSDVDEETDLLTDVTSNIDDLNIEEAISPYVDSIDYIPYTKNNTIELDDDMKDIIKIKLHDYLKARQ